MHDLDPELFEETIQARHELPDAVLDPLGLGQRHHHDAGHARGQGQDRAHGARVLLQERAHLGELRVLLRASWRDRRPLEAWRHLSHLEPRVFPDVGGGAQRVVPVEVDEALAGLHPLVAVGAGGEARELPLPVGAGELLQGRHVLRVVEVGVQLQLAEARLLQGRRAPALGAAGLLAPHRRLLDLLAPRRRLLDLLLAADSRRQPSRLGAARGSARQLRHRLGAATRS
mmetsp:Transcript_53903/g.157265  ORF Transcript_53903/g.157265 Transcript_53903/m.157265 type:complete len:229 (-) Transcript_53903:63-749(-)